MEALRRKCRCTQFRSQLLKDMRLIVNRMPLNQGNRYSACARGFAGCARAPAGYSTSISRARRAQSQQHRGLYERARCSLPGGGTVASRQHT